MAKHKFEKINKIPQKQFISKISKKLYKIVKQNYQEATFEYTFNPTEMLFHDDRHYLKNIGTPFPPSKKCKNTNLQNSQNQEIELYLSLSQIDNFISSLVELYNLDNFTLFYAIKLLLKRVSKSTNSYKKITKNILQGNLENELSHKINIKENKFIQEIDLIENINIMQLQQQISILKYQQKCFLCQETLRSLLGFSIIIAKKMVEDQPYIKTNSYQFARIFNLISYNDIDLLEVKFYSEFLDFNAQVSQKDLRNFFLEFYTTNNKQEKSKNSNYKQSQQKPQKKEIKVKNSKFLKGFSSDILDQKNHQNLNKGTIQKQQQQQLKNIPKQSQNNNKYNKSISHQKIN